MIDKSEQMSFLWPALVKVEFQDLNLYKTILEDEKKIFPTFDMDDNIFRI